MRSYVKEELELLAPSLEVANSLLKAERREGREVSSEVIDAILAEIHGQALPTQENRHSLQATPGRSYQQELSLR